MTISSIRKRLARYLRKSVRIIRKKGLRSFFSTLKYFLYVHFIRARDYQRWIKKHEVYSDSTGKASREFKYQPKFSFVVPVYNTPPKWLSKCIASVVGQYYTNWELCLFDNGSTDQGTIQCLKEWQLKDERIKVARTEKNLHISGVLTDL